LALADLVTLTRTRGPVLVQCDHPDVPTERRNLVWKAASVLWRAGGLGRGAPRGVTIRIAKRIPAAAGLGGGSADAAVTLVGLNRLWELGLDAASLSRLGASIGADVPFFLVGGTALGLGRGDDIYPLADMPRVYVVLIQPAFGIATADAYRWYDEQPRPLRKAPSARPAPAGWPEWAATLGNDLEAPVVRRHPAIGRIRQSLREAGAAVAMMSGSGSAVFGLFERADAARRTARDLARPGWTVVATRTLNRRECGRRGKVGGGTGRPRRG
jgi:4-diphosphocytidyl-2-C-methyl-D-erythritol kinase